MKTTLCPRLIKLAPPQGETVFPEVGNTLKASPAVQSKGQRSRAGGPLSCLEGGAEEGRPAPSHAAHAEGSESPQRQNCRPFSCSQDAVCPPVPPFPPQAGFPVFSGAAKVLSSLYRTLITSSPHWILEKSPPPSSSTNTLSLAAPKSIPGLSGI